MIIPRIEEKKNKNKKRNPNIENKPKNEVAPPAPEVQSSTQNLPEIVEIEPELPPADSQELINLCLNDISNIISKDFDDPPEKEENFVEAKAKPAPKPQSGIPEQYQKIYSEKKSAKSTTEKGLGEIAVAVRTVKKNKKNRNMVPRKIETSSYSTQDDSVDAQTQPKAPELVTIDENTIEQQKQECRRIIRTNFIDSEGGTPAKGNNNQPKLRRKCVRTGNFGRGPAAGPNVHHSKNFRGKPERVLPGKGTLAARAVPFACRDVEKNPKGKTECDRGGQPDIPPNKKADVRGTH